MWSNTQFEFQLYLEICEAAYIETNQSAEYVRGSSVIFESCRLSVDNLRKYSVNFKKPSCAWMFSNFLPKGSGDLTSMLLNYGLPSVCYIAFKVSYIFSDSFIFITFTVDITTSVVITFRLDDAQWYTRTIEEKIYIIIHTP